MKARQLHQHADVDSRHSSFLGCNRSRNSTVPFNILAMIVHGVSGQMFSCQGQRHCATRGSRGHMRYSLCSAGSRVSPSRRKIEQQSGIKVRNAAHRIQVPTSQTATFNSRQEPIPSNSHSYLQATSSSSSHINSPEPATGSQAQHTS